MKILVKTEHRYNTALTVLFRDLALKSRYRRVIIKLNHEVIEAFRHGDAIAIKTNNRVIYVKEILISAKNITEDNSKCELHVEAEYIY